MLEGNGVNGISHYGYWPFSVAGVFAAGVVNMAQAGVAN